MIKKTINYTDYDGNARKETCYFNLSEFEATELGLELPEGIVDAASTNASNDNDEIAVHLVERLGAKGIKDFVKDVVKKSYGVKSPDGKRFMKSEELFTEFSQTPAYSEFMMQLLTNDEAASEFINDVILSNIRAVDKKNVSKKLNLPQSNVVDNSEA